jgi:hypothetical protein
LALLGATARQSATFLWMEGFLIFALGAVHGIVTRPGIAAILVA